MIRVSTVSSTNELTMKPEARAGLIYNQVDVTTADVYQNNDYEKVNKEPCL